MPDGSYINLSKEDETEEFLEYEIFDHYSTELNVLKNSEEDSLINTARIFKSSMEKVKEIVTKYATLPDK